MSEALAWVGEVAAWLGRWFPRWDVCPPTHAGVRFRGRFFRSGIETRSIVPGLYWWWPARTEVVTIPVARQSVDLPSQSLDTRDGKSVLVSATLVIEIADPVKALTSNVDVVDTVREIGAAGTVDSVVGRTSAQLRTAFAEGDVDQEILKAARGLLRRYGVRVIDARLTDCAHHSVVRVEGGAGYPIPATEDE